MTTGKSYDLYKQMWAVHDIPKDVDYDDSVFTKQYEEKFGEPPEVVIRERLVNIVRVWVGPVEPTGPLADVLGGISE